MQIIINDVNKLTDLERQILRMATAGGGDFPSFKIKPADLPDAGISIADMPDAGKVALPPIRTVDLPKTLTQKHFEEAFDPNAAFGNAPSIAGAVPSPIAPITSTLPNVSSPFAAPSNNQALVPTAITQSPVAPLSNPAQTDTDKNGFPWHADIHSSTKAKNADGSWRYKRGVDPAVISAVENQLRSALTAPPVPQAPLAALDTSILTWPVLIQELTGLMSTNRLTNDQITKICKESGVEQFSMLAARPDLFKNVLFRCQQLASVA